MRWAHQASVPTLPVTRLTRSWPACYRLSGRQLPEYSPYGSLSSIDLKYFVILHFIAVNLFSFRLIEHSDSGTFRNGGGIQFLHGTVLHLHLKVVFKNASKCL